MKWWQFKKRDADLERELQSDLELEEEEQRERGVSPAEARYAARRAFGNAALIREQTHEAWGWATFERFWQDLQYAIRGLRNSPVFTVVCVFSLALGIGATATIFGVFEAVFFNAVTARNAERVVHIEIGEPRVSYRQYQELSTDMPLLSGLAAYDETSLSFRSGSDLEIVDADVVSANFFTVLGVAPALGRTFTWDDNRPEKNPQVVVLSHSFWEQRFHANRRILGEVIELNREPFTVVGILSKGYRSIHGYGIAPDIYLPISGHILGDLDNSDETRLELIGRLKDGVTVSQARASIYAIAHRWREWFQPDRLYPDQVQMYPLTGLEKMRRDGVPVQLGTFFAFLLLVALLVFLIACANVAGLLLARGFKRSHEIALRQALGASRYRVVQQLLTENLALGLLGSGVGMLIYLFASKLIDKIQIRAAVPLELHITLDAHLLTLSVVLALIATVLSGLGPALRGSRSGWNLRSNQIGGDVRQRFSLRRWLVAGQFALAFVLLVSAALFLRSLAEMSHVNPGFDVAPVFTAEVNLDPNSYPQARAQRFFETAMSEIRALPGVRSVSGSAIVPLGVEHWVMSMKVNERIIPRVFVNSITPGYFQTMRIPLLRGRDFQASDRGGTPPVAIVNETFARKYLDNGIDAQISIPHPPSSPGAVPTWSRVQVIGIVADSKYGSLGEEPTPALYWPYSQHYGPLILEVRFETGPATSISAARDIVARLDPSTPVKFEFMKDRLAGALLPTRIASVVLGIIGSLGLVLAAIGIYGLMAFNVSRRTAEIGVRLALGATRAKILRMILQEALTLASAGMATGLITALLVTRPLAGLLSVGMSATDPFSFAVVVLTLDVIALIAAAIPAWRASRIDPMQALRTE